MSSPPPVKRLAYVLLALASFALVSALVRALTPWPEEYGLRAKYEYFREHADEFDTLFIGSSTTYYGIVPELFDERMAERAQPTRSFNFGIGAMVSLETDAVLERLLALRPARLRWVFIDAENWDPRIYDRRNTFSTRSVHWRDLERTRIALEALTRVSPRPVHKDQGRYWKLEEAWTYLRLLGRRWTSAGQGGRILRALLGLDAQELSPARAELEAGRGFVDLDQDRSAEWEARRARFAEQREPYLALAAGIDAANAGGTVEQHFHLAGLLRQIERVRAAGAEPIYFTGPRAAATPVVYRLAEAGILPLYLGFNQPRTYPELYRPELHVDPNHLNRAGAEAWTRLLAERFAEHLERLPE